MGNYASNAQLAARFEDDAAVLALTDNVGGAVADSATQAVLTEAIAAAEGELESAVAAQWDVPVDITDANREQLMRTKTLQLAEILLYERGNNLTDAHKEARASLEQWMDRVAARKRVLPGAAAPTTTAARGTFVSHGSGNPSTSSTRVFTRDKQSDL